MNSESGCRNCLDDLAPVLLWCFILTVAVLLVWFFFIVFAWDLTYRVHTAFLDVPREQFDVLHYAAMTLAKGVAFLFFLIPYLAIRITRKRR